MHKIDGATTFFALRFRQWQLKCVWKFQCTSLCVYKFVHNELATADSIVHNAVMPFSSRLMTVCCSLFLTAGSIMKWPRNIHFGAPMLRNVCFWPFTIVKLRNQSNIAYPENKSCCNKLQSTIKVRKLCCTLHDVLTLKLCCFNDLAKTLDSFRSNKTWTETAADTSQNTAQMSFLWNFSWLSK